MAWVGTEHLCAALCCETPFTRAGYLEPHPTWPWTIAAMWQPQLPWTTCSSASPASQRRIFFLLPNLNLLSFSFKPFPLVLSLYALIKSLSSSLLYAPYLGTEGLQLGHPKASLFQAEQTQFSQPLKWFINYWNYFIYCLTRKKMQL